MIDSAVTNILSRNYWTTLYGLGRSILALGTLFTLLFNSSDLLFYYGLQFESQMSSNVFPLNFFLLFPEEYTWLAKLIAILILVVVIWGVYPRLTGVLHWFIAFSFYTATAHS